MNIDFSFVPKHYASRSHEKMMEVLMDPTAKGPAIHYYMIRGGKDQKNITVWEPGTVGGEYIKTYGHYHVGHLDETYWFIYGQGVMMMQKLETAGNGEMIANKVTEFKAKKVKAGDSVFIPSGYGHLVANIGATYFATADDSPVSFEDKKDEASMPGHADYKKVQEMQGFAFYLIEKDGEPVFVRNKKYAEIKSYDLGGIPLVE
ncbi:MAG: glucose-6-phosphate isomerase family protein [Patescibacteria group bacterium]